MTKYSGKVILTNPAGVPFALSNRFGDMFILQEEISECTSSEQVLEVINRLDGYTPWALAKDTKSYTRFETKDRLNNIDYLLVYKKKEADKNE